MLSIKYTYSYFTDTLKSFFVGFKIESFLMDRYIVNFSYKTALVNFMPVSK